MNLDLFCLFLYYLFCFVLFHYCDVELCKQLNQIHYLKLFLTHEYLCFHYIHLVNNILKVDIYVMLFIYLFVLVENVVPEQTDEAEAGSSGRARCRVFCPDSASACDVISAPRRERTARAPLFPATDSRATNPATDSVPALLLLILLIVIYFLFFNDRIFVI